MNEKEAYQQKIEARIAEWNAEMDKLRAQAKKLAAEGRIEAESRLQDLTIKKEAAEAKLAELRNAGGDAWQELKSGIDRAVRELDESVKRAVSKFSSGR
jgi:hypothetical protein